MKGNFLKMKVENLWKIFFVDISRYKLWIAIQLIKKTATHDSILEEQVSLNGSRKYIGASSNYYYWRNHQEEETNTTWYWVPIENEKEQLYSVLLLIPHTGLNNVVKPQNTTPAL